MSEALLSLANLEELELNYAKYDFKELSSIIELTKQGHEPSEFALNTAPQILARDFFYNLA